MDLTTITASDLKKISSLIEKKAKLTEQIEAIDSELASFGGGAPAAPAKRRGRKPGTKVAKKGARKGAKRASGGGRRGGVRDAIISILKDAGSEGAAVRDIAAKLGKKPANVHAWFQATGKKTPELKKVGTGKWAWVG